MDAISNDLIHNKYENSNIQIFFIRLLVIVQVMKYHSCVKWRRRKKNVCVGCWWQYLFYISSHQLKKQDFSVFPSTKLKRKKERKRIPIKNYENIFSIVVNYLKWFRKVFCEVFIFIFMFSFMRTLINRCVGFNLISLIIAGAIKKNLKFKLI